jgi:hypothetical protein
MGEYRLLGASFFFNFKIYYIRILPIGQSCNFNCSCPWHEAKQTKGHAHFFRSSFWFIEKQQWKIEEITIFSNINHLEWRAELSDTKCGRDISFFDYCILSQLTKGHLSFCNHLVSVVRPSYVVNYHILIFSPETTKPN